MKHETIGEGLYIERKYGVSCNVKIGQTRGKPSDYIYGEIMVGNNVVSVLTGSYMSHLAFDNVRYWDIRSNFPIKIIELEKNLPSSSIYREDRMLLEEGNLKDAQQSKERIENLQRHDRKLREKFSKAKK